MKDNVAYHRVALDIRASILDGTLQPGNKLPGEHALARKFNVSRTTARLALKELEKNSLVYRRQGSGTFVSATPREAPVTRSNFSKFVKGLAGQVVREILRFEWMPTAPELAADLAIPCNSALLHFRRLDRLNGDPMAFDDGWIFGPYAHLLTTDDLAELEFYEHWQEKQSIRICKSSIELWADPASSEQAELLKVKKGAPILVEISEVFTETEGVGRFKTYYRHDMYRFKRTYHESANRKKQP